ncbi:GIY-YIG nuclease family protein [Christiangramia fulva]|uniref:GIY-YIG nuclease family protein n=1 Tax=Christiangramia fulva TaxID=2126553 RepID=UPI00131E0B2A|nr:GIY-YIG nuclease family protein [Christiangramia fulva]
MKISYVYILKCSDNTFYTGVTSNLHKRLLEHRSSRYLFARARLHRVVSQQIGPKKMEIEIIIINETPKDARKLKKKKLNAMQSRTSGGILLICLQWFITSIL